MKKYLFLLISVFTILACSDSSSSDYMHAEATYELMDTFGEAAATGSAQPVNESKKMIKEGAINVWVKDIHQTKVHVDSLVQKNGGYYANETFSNDTYSGNSYTLKIRIPASAYESLISAIEKGPGEKFTKSIQIKDVTEEYLDIQTRLENKRRYLERYRELVKKASSIKEILEIEEIIRTLEEEIESTEGRIRYLTDQVNYSTLHLHIHHYEEYISNTKENKFFYRLKKSINEGLDISFELILIVVTLWPIWIILGVLIFFIKKRRKKKAEKQ